MTALWKDAEKTAQAGSVFKTMEALRLYREYAQRSAGGITQDQEKEILRVTQLANREAIPLLLDKANAAAKTGDVETTRAFLSEAREAASLSGKRMKKAWRTRAKKIEKLALRNSPAFLLPQAQAAAQLGQVEETRRLIQLARDFRAELGLDLNSKQEKSAQSAVQTALLASVDPMLKQAEKVLVEVKRTGDLDPIRRLLEAARENAQLAGGSFSADQEAKAANILSKAAEAAVEWRFGQAERSAKLGKVDDTLVPLNAGREFAKGAGISFDEVRATRLTRAALVNGIELSFTAAEHFAKQGDADNTFFQLDNGRDYARRLEQPFDEERAEEILKLLR
jgi:hypothetical protein